MFVSSSLPRINQYPAPMRNWETFSWIRSKPLQKGTHDGAPYPAKLVALVSHPLIAGQEKMITNILACRLLSHLHFTTLLELAHVNPVCQEMTMGKSLVELTATEKNDALRIYCDEGGHALFVEVLATQIEQIYGVDRNALGRPEFDHRINRIVSKGVSGVSESILRHFFVTISETLVTKVLREIPYDVTVSSIVRSTIADHAADEAAHSVYFKWYFPRLWSTLSARAKTNLGRTLPDFIWAFLAPDLGVDRRILLHLGFTREETQEILLSSYPTIAVAASVRQAATPTLDMIRAAGVLDKADVREKFIEMGLVD